MRTTIELPEDLFRRIKARAALQGRPLKDLVAEGLTLLLQGAKAGASSPSPRRTQFPIIKSKNPKRTLTPEMVATAEEELLAEEAAAAHGRLARH